jgi:hypothetical protein
MGVLSPTLLALLSSLHVTLSPLSSPSLLSISSLSLSSSPSLSLYLSLYQFIHFSLYYHQWCRCTLHHLPRQQRGSVRFKNSGASTSRYCS